MTSGYDVRPDARHRGRELALQMLYQWEVGRTDPVEVCRTFWQLPVDDAPVRTREFAMALMRGTISNLETIDPLITSSAEHWRLERMPVLDRLILRMAVFELTASPEVPAAVVIDEAIELAKTYGTEASGAFINGLVDAIAHRLAEHEAGRPAVESPG